MTGPLTRGSLLVSVSVSPWPSAGGVGVPSRFSDGVNSTTSTTFSSIFLVHCEAFVAFPGGLRGGLGLAASFALCCSVPLLATFEAGSGTWLWVLWFRHLFLLWGQFLPQLGRAVPVAYFVDLHLFSQDVSVMKGGRGSLQDSGIVPVVVQPIFEATDEDIFWPVILASH